MKTRLLLTYLLLTTSWIAFAQTNPTPVGLPFSLTSQTGNTLPGGVAVHKFGSIQTTRTTSAATADLPYNAGTATTNTGAWYGLGADCIAMLCSGTNAAGALIVSINTTGLSNINVSWQCKSVFLQNSRDNSVALQYRIGTTGSFTDVGTTTTYTSNGKLLNDESGILTEVLPVGAENQPEVQVRWIYWESAGSAGSRDKIAVKNISITGSSGTPCTTPSSLAKNNITATGADLSWGTVAGATGYQYALSLTVAPPPSGTDTTTTAFTASGLTSNTKYYYHVRTNCGSGSYSSWVTDSFNTLQPCVVPDVNSNPVSGSTCEGSSKTFAVGATGDGLAYQWQVNTGSGFGNISNTTPYSGVTTNTLTITNAQLSLNSNIYRCMVTGTCGTDSSTEATFTVNASYSINNPQTICDGNAYSFNGHTYTVAGTYNDTLLSVSGCDSIIVTQLTVNPVFTTNNPQTICNGGSYMFNGHTYTTTGNYNDTLVAVTGCDSIIVTQLTVNPTYLVSNPQTICTGSSYVINGHTYNTNGTYYDTLQTVNGCDSIIETQLLLTTALVVNNPQFVCSGNSYTVNGHTYSIAGTYYDTLFAVSGCDSIIVTALTVNPVYSVSNSQTICQGNAYTLNGHTYTLAGTYTDTLLSVSGCDSIITTTLAVNPTYLVGNAQTICQGSAYSFNGHTYTVAGTYNDTLFSVTGCDSIIVTTLSVNAKPTATAVAGGPATFCFGGDVTLNANTGTNLNYQWFEGYNAISLATTTSYVTNASGSYRVLVTDSNSCYDTSAAVVVTVNPKPATSVISGTVAPEINTTHAYSVTNTSGSTYNWMITSGTQTTGTNTSSINVLWGNVVGSGEVRVVETNTHGCIGDTISQLINVMLPVKLIGFTANTTDKHTVLLRWTTAQEINNSHFEVERSVNGKDFAAIGKVKGNGTFNGVLNYTFTDLNPSQNQTNYYRLKQVDFNGNHQYSAIATAKSAALNTATVYPNPVVSGVSALYYELNTASEVSVSIISAIGEVVFTQTNIANQAGAHSIFIPALGTGVYVIKLTTGTQEQAFRVLVQ